MKIGKLQSYVVKHYFSKNRSERKYGLLILGPIGVGKSMVIEEVAKEIAQIEGLEFLKVVVRWSSVSKKFVLNCEGEHLIEDVLANSDKYFVFSDFRLSTIEPTDLSGVPRSRDGITYYDPMLWATLHSASKGLVFMDELVWVQREDVWAVAPMIVLDKVAGMTKFHKDTLVIAAGNRPEDASTIVRQIHNPLLNRFKIMPVDGANDDEWAEYMSQKYDDNWDKRTYAFMKRFADDNVSQRVPATPEGLEEFPTRRSWTWVALDLVVGYNSLEDLVGLLGQEVGQKLFAFLKLNVDIEELIKEPDRFNTLNFDSKYMVPIMLASWTTQNIKQIDKVEKSFSLVDTMSAEKHEFLVMTCVCMELKNLKVFLGRLFAHNPKYREILGEIALSIKDQIAA